MEGGREDVLARTEGREERGGGGSKVGAERGGEGEGEGGGRGGEGGGGGEMQVEEQKGEAKVREP